MGFRFSRRINIGKGLGLNVSTSGITPSLRTKFGSINTKGFLIKTGISGTSYRGSFGKSGGCILVIMIELILAFLLNI